MKKSKKLLSLFLTLCMALTLSPTVALAAEDTPIDDATTQQEPAENDTYEKILPDETDADGEEKSADTAEDGIVPQADDDAPTSGTCGENLTWTLDSGTLTISGIGKMTDYTNDNKSPWRGNRAINQIIIEDGITSIGDAAFYNCDGLNNITIPDSIISIGDLAFFDCYIFRKITIPNSVTSIGNLAFGNCNNLRNITIPDNVTRIGEEAFRAAFNLRKIVISKNVASIKKGTFYLCNHLESITIPDSVTNIEAGAFGICNNLKDIYYSGNEQQWKAIIIDPDNNDCLCSESVTIHYNSIGSDEIDSPSTERKSGNSDWNKMSKEEIKALLEANPTYFAGEIYEVEPSYVAPYATGKVTTAALQAATNRLNALRKIAGVPAVTLSKELSENAQYGAVLMSKLGNMTHYPDKPNDMDQDFFAQAAEAARTSNLSLGSKGSLIGVADGLMLDDSGSNLESVGHRSWQLNPSMGQVGFGYAEDKDSRYRSYTVEKAHDKSGSGCTYDFISWPASGNFPTGTFFRTTTPWSITVNPERYIIPDKSQITVTLTRVSDNKSWTFSSSDDTTNDKRYFNVNNQNYGVGNCIIFRPDGIEKYEGLYTVKIEGLEMADDTPVADFTYTVDFFDPTPEEPIESYTVTYNSDGGTGHMDSQTVESGETFTLPNRTFTKEGFTFAGWSDGTKTYQTGDTYTMPAHNVTFIAQWTAIVEPPKPTTYTITFNANGGVLSGSATMTTDENGKLASLPTPTHEGYTFDGWFTATSSGEQIATDHIFTSNTTIYAHWTQNGDDTPENPDNPGDDTPENPISTYTIFFDTNGGTLSGSATRTTDADGKLASLPSATRGGYTFSGWFTATNGGEQITTDTVFNADTTVYAHWSYNGGSSSSGGSSGGGSHSGGGSSGGGGSSSGGSSGLSNITTTTTKNPDGSTTTTTQNNSTGAVTTTTTDAAGNKTETVITQKDGSSVATVTRKDGTTATITTSAAGQVKAEVKLSAEAVSVAQQNNQAVALPIHPVQAVRDTAAAPSVTVNTGSAESVKIEIPVTNPTPGTVAILIHADGTEEIIKTSIPTANGVTVSLPDGATVKMVENSKEFTDVTAENWAKDASDFVTARELFLGTSADTFSPDRPMTRVMLMTVLARFNGVDTSGGSTWYEKGMMWAIDNGISDGSNPNGNISRQQLAVMLWRYSDKPAPTGNLDAFDDAGEVSDYAQEAMRWAVENGVINGYGDGRLNAQGQATRAEVAQMLKNFIER